MVVCFDNNICNCYFCFIPLRIYFPIWRLITIELMCFRIVDVMRFTLSHRSENLEGKTLFFGLVLLFNFMFRKTNQYYWYVCYDKSDGFEYVMLWISNSIGINNVTCIKCDTTENNKCRFKKRRHKQMENHSEWWKWNWNWRVCVYFSNTWIDRLSSTP